METGEPEHEDLEEMVSVKPTIKLQKRTTVLKTKQYIRIQFFLTVLKLQDLVPRESQYHH